MTKLAMAGSRAGSWAESLAGGTHVGAVGEETRSQAWGLGLGAFLTQRVELLHLELMQPLATCP
jgi:hypothetical protein